MKKEIRQYMKEIGKRGGEKTKQRGVEHYRAIGRAGARKRWARRSVTGLNDER